MPGPRRDPADGAVALDRRRYLRVVAFLGRVFAHVLFWDVAVRRLLPGDLAPRTADRRWRSLAGRFRSLAVAQGGVLIKLGQFLSIRVDVLPPSVTAELSGLQDEVPPESYEAMVARIESAFGREWSDVFAALEPGPLGAASLAQVHRAELPDGRPVVVKVQRPRIATLVETDLAALRFGVAVLKRFGWFRRRADLDLLYEEFARTTRGELDFVAEGRNTEAFAKQFGADPRVCVPRVHWAQTRPTVLTLEDVSGIKVTDVSRLREAGIEPAEVAARVVDLYFEQIFVHNYVHVDPHPGNLFVRPQDAGAAGPDAPAFRIAFVDFGMMAVVPERVREHLREYLIGLATRDAARIVRAYDGAGMLLPTADRRRVEQAQAEILNRFWGVRIGELQSLAMTQARALAREFADLLREMPFQLPADLLFIGRAVGILSGLATTLDPDFNLWTAVAPYARRLAAGAGGPEPRRGARSRLEARWDELEARLRELAGLAGLAEAPVRSLLVLPGELERVLSQAAAGQLVLQHDLAPRLQSDVDRAIRVGRRLVWTVALAATVLAGAIIRVAEGPSPLSNAMLLGSGIALLLLLLRR